MSNIRLNIFIFLFFGISYILSADEGDFKSTKYTNQTKEIKMNLLWDAITKEQTSLNYFPDEVFNKEFFSQNMADPFVWEQDILFAKGRKKLIHTQGLIAKAEYISTPENTYTGIFEGSKYSIIRLSLVDEPDTTFTTPEAAFNNFSPSFAIKFLIDRSRATNWFGMFSFTGQNSWNFFKNDLTNSLPKPTDCGSCPRENKINEGQSTIGHIGLSHSSQINESGQKPKISKWPYKLIYRPNPEIRNMFTDDYTENWKNQISRIPRGTRLYDVYAIDSPTSTSEKLIGFIQITTQFYTSRWGDEFMNFQHGFAANDLMGHKDWGTAIWKWSKPKLLEYMSTYHSKEMAEKYIAQLDT
jgi:hypothetical protein